MRHRFNAFAALALTLAFVLAGPASAQGPAMVSATPQQKDAWGEDIVRYCAAQIQTYNREDAKRFDDAPKVIAQALEAALYDEGRVPKSYAMLEIAQRSAAVMRQDYEQQVKNHASAASLAIYRRRMAEYDAGACIASRAMYLLAGAREAVTVWNKSPDTVDVWLNSTVPVCTAKPNQYCNVSVPTGAPTNIVGGVSGVAKYGPYKFDPVGDGARMLVLGEAER